ncbi:radial spoke head protein 9-like [Scleropages formosus]|uniref:Radial spoke head protein 9 homolog n=1 Tax=Scleropages formosus TaxID=113540 RepID=A0A0P7Z4J6_SCLFO|nr:radial spoke head protein 9 homolog [Scleropages formosus]KPP75514.1 radial spoke head protein 9-like [Scleropages formosus]
MDSDSLRYSLDLVSGCGLTLSCEQRAALQTSLLILKRNYKFSRVLFWGKILGLRSDYFIAHGITEDEMRNRKTLYSFNCVDWHLLPPVTEAQLAEVSLLKEHFKGDPSYEYEHTETRGLDEGDEAVVEEITVKMTEETRLAATVFNIDREVSVVPRGAFIKTPSGRVQVNRCFEGLSESEARKLSSYLHFSEPQHLKKKTILETADLNPSIDFLDNLSEDTPKGSWSLQFERGSISVLRSLLWLGLTFFHVPMTPQHGYIYMGDGMKNHYLPFML